MSQVNQLECIVSLNNESQKSSNKILAEGPENIDHNKSVEYIQAIICFVFNAVVYNYLALCYDKPFNYEDVKKMTMIKNNKDRSDDKIPEKGEGLKRLMYKYATNFFVVSNHGDSNEVIYNKFKVKKYISELTKYQDEGKSVDSNKFISEMLPKYETLEVCSRGELPCNIAEFIKILNESIKKSDFKEPKGVILLEITDEGLKDINKEEIYDLFSKKYSYNIFHKICKYGILTKEIDKELELIELKPIDSSGLLSKKKTYKLIIYYKKQSNNEYILYFKNSDKYHYYRVRKSFIEKEIEAKPTIEEADLQLFSFIDLEVGYGEKKGFNGSQQGIWYVTCPQDKKKSRVFLKSIADSTDDVLQGGARTLQARSQIGGIKNRNIIMIKNTKVLDIKGAKHQTTIKDDQWLTKAVSYNIKVFNTIGKNLKCKYDKILPDIDIKYDDVIYELEILIEKDLNARIKRGKKPTQPSSSDTPVIKSKKNRKNFSINQKNKQLLKQKRDGLIRCPITDIIISPEEQNGDWDHIDNDKTNISSKNIQFITTKIHGQKTRNSEKYKNIVKDTAKYLKKEVHNITYKNKHLTQQDKLDIATDILKKCRLNPQERNDFIKKLKKKKKKKKKVFS